MNPLNSLSKAHAAVQRGSSMRSIRQRCAISVLLIAASTAAFGQSADKAVADVLQGVSAGNVVALWDALPASYQQDISFLVHAGAAELDPVIYAEAFALVRKIVGILADKKQMILASPLLAEHPEVGGAAYDPMVEMMSLLATSDISESEKLEHLDVAAFLAGSGATIAKQGMALYAQMGRGPGRLAALKDVKVTLVSQGSGVATLEFEAPGKPAKTEAYVRVDGKWLPRKMAADWTVKVSEAKAKLQRMVPQLDDARKQQLVTMMDAIGAQLDLLAKAEDQQQFNVQLMMTQMSLIGLAAQMRLHFIPHE